MLAVSSNGCSVPMTMRIWATCLWTRLCIVHRPAGQCGSFEQRAFCGDAAQRLWFRQRSRFTCTFWMWLGESKWALGAANVIKLPTDDATANGFDGGRPGSTSTTTVPPIGCMPPTLKGVWKFDISSSDPSNWGSAYLLVTRLCPCSRPARMQTARATPCPSPRRLSSPSWHGRCHGGFWYWQVHRHRRLPKTNLNQRFYTIWDRGNFNQSFWCRGRANAKRALLTMAKLVGRKLVRNDQTGAVTLADADAAVSINWTDQTVVL